MDNWILFGLVLLTLALAFVFLVEALDRDHWTSWLAFSAFALISIFFSYLLGRRLWEACHAVEDPNLANEGGNEQAPLAQPQDQRAPQPRVQPAQQGQGQRRIRARPRRASPKPLFQIVRRTDPPEYDGNDGNDDYHSLDDDEEHDSQNYEEDDFADCDI